eukprot:g4428.t1
MLQRVLAQLPPRLRSPRSLFCSSHANDLLVSAARGHYLTGAESQADLVEGLVKGGIVQEGSRLVTVLAALDRAKFLPRTSSTDKAYENNPRDIGHGMTMSTPQFHAEILQALEPNLLEGNAALDIGCGTGYIASAFAQLVGPSGRVHAIEAIKPILHEAQRISDEISGEPGLGSSMAPIVFEEQSDLMMHAAESGDQKYDAIYVAPALETRQQVEYLTTRLNPGGRMLVPVADVTSGAQTLYTVTTDTSGLIDWTKLMPCACQPLLHGKSLENAANFVPRRKRTRKEELEKCKAELEEWKATFVSEHGRKPSRDDLQSDATGSELFARFVQASKLGCF